MSPEEKLLFREKFAKIVDIGMEFAGLDSIDMLGCHKADFMCRMTWDDNGVEQSTVER